MEKEMQKKTQRRRSGRTIGIIKTIGPNEYQIATPKLGVFTSSDLPRLKAILKEDGHRPVVKPYKREE